MNLRRLRLSALPQTDVPVCTFWLQGRCNRSPCRFAHPPLHQPSPPACPKNSQILRKGQCASSNAVQLEELLAKKKEKMVWHRTLPSFPAHADSAAQPASLPLAQANVKPEPVVHNQEASIGDPERAPNIGSDAGALITCLLGHQAPICGIALPEPCSIVFAAHQDGFMRAWDCSTGSCCDTFALGSPANCTYASASDPAWLFVGLATEVRVIDLYEKVNYSLPVQSPVLCLTSVGDILVAGLENGTLLMWRFESNSKFFLSWADANCSSSPVVSLDNICGPALKLLFCGCADGTIVAWEVTSGRRIHSVQAHKGAVSQIISCGDKLLLSSSHEDASVRLWCISASTSASDCSSLSSSEEFLTYCATYSPQEGSHPAGAQLRCGSANATNCAPLGLCGTFEDGEERSPVLFVACSDHTVHIVDVPSLVQRNVIVAKHPIGTLATGPGNVLLLGSSSSGGELSVWRWK